jgi:broad specificity phosphatase PhoE
MGESMVQDSESDFGHVPVPGLNGQILSDKKTGQIYLKGPVVHLEFPMIIVRHGETDGNRRKVLHGLTNGPENQLNETGKEQAKQLAMSLFAELEQTFGRRLAELARSGDLIILTSPLKRARDTAQFFIDYVKEKSGLLLELEVLEDLREISFGKIDGLALDEIKDEELRGLVVRYRTTQDATINWQGTGESFVDTLIRAKRLLQTLNRRYQGRDVVVVSFTHGTFGSSLRAVTGDKGLVKGANMIAFRDNILGCGVPHWLSRQGIYSEAKG